MIGTRRATEAGEPTHPRQDFANASIDAIERDGLQTAMLNHKVGMVVKILATAGRSQCRSMPNADSRAAAPWDSSESGGD